MQTPIQANTRRRTSNSCKCSQRRKCTVLRKHGAGTTGLGLPRVLSNGVGNSVCRLGYCLRKLMLLASNVTPRCQTSAVFQRVIDKGNNSFPFLMRLTMHYGVQGPLLGDTFGGVVVREIHKNTRISGHEIFFFSRFRLRSSLSKPPLYLELRVSRPEASLSIPVRGDDLNLTMVLRIIRLLVRHHGPPTNTAQHRDKQTGSNGKTLAEI
jgi:hypothetical protein